MSNMKQIGCCYRSSRQAELWIEGKNTPLWWENVNGDLKNFVIYEESNRRI